MKLEANAAYCGSVLLSLGNLYDGLNFAAEVSDAALPTGQVAQQSVLTK